MTCTPGQPCEEGRKRGRALGALLLMAAIFVALSFASFVKSRNQVVPSEVHYANFDAVQGKRVFQAYNCMGCHTLLGNGAYFGPDLTNVYEHAGPAWLAAFLPSAGGWPTRPAVQVHLADADQQADTGIKDMDAYLKKFPGAAERIARRGGHDSYMPNLPITGTEVKQLIAFLKYTSEMNTMGWPPKPQVDGLAFPQAKPFPQAAAAPNTGAAPSPGAPQAAADPAQQGKELAAQLGCTACHATDGTKKVGPGWGGLFGHPVRLADGNTVTADDAYLAESIRSPNAKVPEGFTAGVMPAYDAATVPDDQVAAIVAYIHTLQGGGK